MPKRAPNKTARDRRLIAALYLQGMIQSEIAKWVGVSQGTVSNDLTAIQEIWQKRSVMAMDDRKRDELAKIDMLEMTYWEGYIKSTYTVEHSTIFDQETGEWMIETVEIPGVKPGDPRFLAGVRGCIQDRVDLFGLKAAEKVDVRVAAAIRVIGGIDLETDI